MLIIYKEKIEREIYRVTERKRDIMSDGKKEI